MMELPKLTKKQQQFVLYYLTNGNNATEAYKKAYDCKNMKDNSITVEASKLLKNPNVALWTKQAQNNIREVFEEEIKYSAKDCFDELEEMKNLALVCFDKAGNPNVNSAIKTIELKGKLAGHFVDKHQVTGIGLADVLDQLK